MGKFKFYLAAYLVGSSFFICGSVFSFSDQIDGVFVPQGNFDSKFPVVTMKLSKIHPPVVRIAPSRPTVLVFPNQVSSCVNDNKALIIEKGNPMKVSTENLGFSTVILKVDVASLVAMDIPEQTVINCQLIDSNIYPIGVLFTDNNSYSVVKLLENKQKKIDPKLDMNGFYSIRLSEKNPINLSNDKVLNLQKKD